MRTHPICLALAVGLVCPFASGQWVRQESGTIKNLHGVYFTDSKTGTVVGDSGTILRTTDGGATWMSQSSGTLQSLEKVFFVDANLGWGVGDSGAIIHTTDGGVNWSAQASGTRISLNSVYFIDMKTGWADGGNYWYDGKSHYHGILLHTTDGGAKWSSVRTDSMIVLRSAYFSNRDTGFVVGDVAPAPCQGIILRTTNGGISWDTTRTHALEVLGKRHSDSQLAKLESTENSLVLPQRHLARIQFTDSLTGWIVGWDSNLGPWAGDYQAIILNTRNGGVHWSSRTSVGGAIFTSSYFVDSSTGWVVGAVAPEMSPDTAAIWLTTNAGSTWNTQFLEPSSPMLGDINFVDTMNGWAVGDNGTILRTTNGGITWVEGQQRGLPQHCLLSQNYPNPFNPSTTIKYELPQSAMVRLSVYDILGREVSVLVSERKDVGGHEVNFDAEGLASGVYVYRIQAGDFVQAKKFVILK